MTVPATLVATPRFHKQWLLAREPVRFFNEIAAEFGDFVHVRGLLDMVFINHPDLVAQVLGGREGTIERQGAIYERLANVGRSGLASSDGAYWKKQRRTVAPLFTANAIRNLGDVMIDAAETCRTEWRDRRADGDAFEMKEAMNRLTLAINARCLFSAEVDDRYEDLQRWFAIIKRYMEEFPFPLVSRWWFPSPMNLRTKATLRSFDAYTTSLIESRRRNEGAAANDLLSRMLDAGASEENAMTDDAIRHEMLTFFIAGYETASTAMSWTWLHLAQNPDVEAKLHAELDAVLGDGALRIDQLPHLAYTKRVIDEVMRRTPAAWFMGRTAAADFELSGAKIAKGTMFAISIPALHNHPRFWPDPERFDPDRFLPSAVASRPAHAYVPFARGAHTCIGKHFASMELVIVLATLAREFRVSLVDGGFREEVAAGISMAPKHGMHMRVSPRATKTGSAGRERNEGEAAE